jgi:hypothetical protein
LEAERKPRSRRSFSEPIEHEAIEQLINLPNLEIVHPHVAAMPDVHAGIATGACTRAPLREGCCAAPDKHRALRTGTWMATGG